ncbi:MAG: hypothetical protein C7B43_04350 [Sulfobacillus benefaciens]|uniref:Hemerythrin-like domain-containing protein n=1 Tax=Sulfobacillus benefaciens TaxID=453960 RepID=A0A2T2X8S1_9FIRM|nr:MAG: hypothetical protein C7B43_04350 [Sulfobacillus benefaciens]
MTMMSMHDQVALLSQEHSNVESRLFLLSDALEESDDGDVRWREETVRDVLQYMAVHLLEHMKTEEETVFPYGTRMGLANLVTDLTNQHDTLRHDLSHLLEELARNWPGMKEGGNAFVALLQDHIAQEETAFFPLIDA